MPRKTTPTTPIQPPTIEQQAESAIQFAEIMVKMTENSIQKRVKDQLTRIENIIADCKRDTEIYQDDPARTLQQITHYITWGLANMSVEDNARYVSDLARYNATLDMLQFLAAQPNGAALVVAYVNRSE